MGEASGRAAFLARAMEGNPIAGFWLFGSVKINGGRSSDDALRRTPTGFRKRRETLAAFEERTGLAATGDNGFGGGTG